MSEVPSGELSSIIKIWISDDTAKMSGTSSCIFSRSLYVGIMTVVFTNVEWLLKSTVDGKIDQVYW